MKKLFKFIITAILTSKARQYLKKHRVQVIAITGSIGKTTTKEAIYHLLKDRFKVFKSPQGFNTEVGISLAILQEEKSGFTSPLRWIGILKRAFCNKREIFKKAIIEMGADKPGDLKKLVRIAKPSISVVTNVNPVHLAKGQFKDIEAIRKEKETLVKCLDKNGLAVLNADDPLVKSMETRAATIFYGIEEDAEVKAQNIKITAKNIQFEVIFKNKTASFEAPILGKFQLNTLLPAITVALKLGVSLSECADSLKTFKMPLGRMNPIPGISKSTIIDSSYNASPVSMTKALELLAELKAERKIAVLGAMNELGGMTKEAHLALGAQVCHVADMLIAVGQEAAVIKQGALEAGMSENRIFTFFDSEEAGHHLKTIIKPKDLILVKGSQNRVRLERLVKIIMARPEQASILLCRQDDAWEKI